MRLKTIDVPVGDYGHYAVEGMIEDDRQHIRAVLREEIANMKGVYSAKDAIDKALTLIDTLLPAEDNKSTEEMPGFEGTMEALNKLKI